MKSSHRTKLLLVLVGTLTVGFGVASAQEAQPAPAIANPQFGTSADAALTPAQMFDKARQSLERMEAGAENLRRQLREARQGRDVVKALCLDDKLTQMNVAKRTATERVAGLESAVKTANTERARHEYAVVGALSERADSLNAEANQCLGEETGFIGDSRLTLTVDPNIANTDPTVPTDPLDSERPVLWEPPEGGEVPPPPVMSPTE